MKNIKKIIALMLAVIMLSSAFIFPSAAADAAEEPAEDPIVARMHFGHLTRNHNIEGHTWIYIENLTNKTLEIGAGYKLAKGKGVSIGSYGTSVDKPGLYYNVEAYRYQNPKYIELSISISKELTQSDLDKVNSTIKKCNHWSYFFNCAYAAIKIWNAVPGDNMIYLFAPILTMMQVLASKNDTKGFPMTYGDWKKDCFFQVAEGGTVTLEPADPTY